MRFFQMFFKYNSSTFDNLIIENQICFYWIIGHKLFALHKMDNVILAIVDQRFRIDMRYHISNFIMLFQDRGDSIFDVLVTLHEFYLFLEYGCSETANILDFFLEIHQSKSG